MRTFAMIIAAGYLLSFVAFAQDKVGGGGDGAEVFVDEIRAEILDWIGRGGAKGLKFPAGMTVEKYEREMKKILASKKVMITFVDDDSSPDPDLRVEVDGKPKACRGFVKAENYHMLCHLYRFFRMSANSWYVLLHHEYAGLAGIERNEGGASDYVISKQLAGFSQLTRALKLSIKKGANPCGQVGSLPERIADCSEVKEGTSFIVVTRTQNLQEILFDPKAKLVWSYRLPFVSGYAHAESACSNFGNYDDNSYLEDTSFRLPTTQEFLVASRHGLTSAIPYKDSTHIGPDRNRYWLKKEASAEWAYFDQVLNKVMKKNEESDLSSLCVIEADRFVETAFASYAGMLMPM